MDDEGKIGESIVGHTGPAMESVTRLDDINQKGQVLRCS